MKNNCNRFSKKDATKIASAFLKENSKIKEIFLFGSIARGKLGGDIDFIFTTDDVTFRRYFLKVKEKASELICHYQPRMVRLLAVLNILSIKVNIDEILGKDILEDCYIDIFVFPSDWKNKYKLEELQKIFPHRDKDFMKDIAHDAILLKNLPSAVRSC